MQSLNDDMEDLFKRAGKEYPLNTNDADWAKVMQKLHRKDDDLHEENRKKKDYKFLWLLLLLPVGFICGKYIGNGSNELVSKGKEININSGTNNKLEYAKPANQLKNREERKFDSRKAKEVTYEKARKTVDTKTQNLGNRNAADDFVVNKKESIKQKVITSETVTSFPKTLPTEDAKDKVINATIVTSPKEHLKEKETKNSTSDKSSFDRDSVHSVTSDIKQDDALSLDKATKKTDTFTDTVPASSINKKIKPSVKGKLYYSIVVGPDISTIKFEKLSSAGYSAGLMLGYRFKGNFSVEAGLLWDKKSYYSKGEYLDTSRLKLPMHSMVLNANGNCNIYEFPVKIRYDFATKTNHSWFISAGLSSYFMKKEDYNISYIRYNQPYIKDYGYKNSSTNWFSIMNVSAGYQRSIGRYSNISIAPYVKLPLKGVGIGRLPITSTGIYISFSRSIK